MEPIRRQVKVPVSVEAALNADLCPDCSSSMAHEEGCLKCYSCGYSKC